MGTRRGRSDVDSKIANYQAQNREYGMNMECLSNQEENLRFYRERKRHLEELLNRNELSGYRLLQAPHLMVPKFPVYPYHDNVACFRKTRVSVLIDQVLLVLQD